MRPAVCVVVPVYKAERTIDRCVASILNQKVPGGVACGCQFPGFDPKMHAPNEQASVELLLTSCKIFTQAIVELCQ